MTSGTAIGRAATARRVWGCVALAGLLAIAGLGPGQAEPRRYNDRQLTDGFLKTVFGLEYASANHGDHYVKKYVRPVRVYIDNRAKQDRRAAVKGFIAEIGRSVSGLDIRTVASPGQANFRVFVVDRAQYESIIKQEVFGDRGATAYGKCMVRVVSSPRGIRSSAAVIVSDEGRFLFERCMTEEILQGLGPLNDDLSLGNSVFNDSSRLARFTRHDRAIVKMLYHSDIRPGMTRAEVNAVLPRVIRDIRGEVR